MNKKYYSYILELVSPLSLSSGLNKNSDKDVLLDCKGRPFIPATSIAGVLASKMNDDDRKTIFGIGKNGDFENSKVIFYDALLCNKNADITIRDSVGLENKVAKNSAKFDFEAVEPGICFCGFFEFDDELQNDGEQKLITQLSALNNGMLRLGHKTTRGYGQVRIRELKKIGFTDVDKWLDFDMYNTACWKDAEEVELKEYADNSDSIKLSLTLKSALSIRVYTTELPEDADYAPDYKYMALRDGTPVIPGTTWAGAFRDRFTLFTDDQTRNELFGYIDENTKNTKKSDIVFSESEFKAGTYTKKLITRNSIDRFSAATNDGALYTELTIYGGQTDLTITMPSSTPTELKAAVYACIEDLDNGFMAIGGLTSVGRGLFEVNAISVNGDDKTEHFKAYNIKALTGGEQ